MPKEKECTNIDLNNKLDRILTELSAMNNGFTELKKEVNEVKDSIAFISTEFEVISRNNVELTTLVDSHKKEITEINQKQESMVAKMQLLEFKLDFEEKKNLLNNVSLVNVPIIPKQDLNTTIAIILDKAKVTTLKTDDLLVMYRKKEKRNGSPGEVILKCKDQDSKKLIIKALKITPVSGCDIKRQLKENKRIFANEELTALNRSLFYKASVMKKSQCFKYLWTSAGNVLIKVNDGLPVIWIRKEEDLLKFNISN